MKTLETVKIGDKVVIYHIDKMVFDYLSFGVQYGTKIDRLRILCELKENTKYKVTDICKSCKSLTIKVGKNHTSINYKYIEAVL